jgi:hypothetical protein
MWRTLSSRQRSALIGLGLANLILLVAIAALALSPAPGTTPTVTPLPLHAANACQAEAARALAKQNIAGIVAIRDDGSIDFTMSGDDPADAWVGFAISAELPKLGCGPYNPIRVDAPDPSRIANRRLVVEASWLDVQAWSQGHIDDAALSERMTRASYTRPDLSP